MATRTPPRSKSPTFANVRDAVDVARDFVGLAATWIVLFALLAALAR